MHVQFCCHILHRCIPESPWVFWTSDGVRQDFLTVMFLFTTFFFFILQVIRSVTNTTLRSMTHVGEAAVSISPKRCPLVAVAVSTRTYKGEICWQLKSPGLSTKHLLCLIPVSNCDFHICNRMPKPRKKKNYNLNILNHDKTWRAFKVVLVPRHRVFFQTKCPCLLPITSYFNSQIQSSTVFIYHRWCVI